MSGLIIFEDAETIVGTWLQERLAAHDMPLPVSTMAPDDTARTGPAHTPYIRLQVIGGELAGLVTEDVDLLIESYADGAVEAISAAMICRAFFHSAPHTPGSPIYAVTETGRPAPLPDPRTGLTRYTQTQTVRLRAARA
jgi:hypothetical protein